MNDTPTDEAATSEDRFRIDERAGSERRSWHDRRESDQQTSAGDPAGERRGPTERRTSGERRVMLLDRRRKMSDPYATRHAELIREMLLNPEMPVACPRCGGELVLGQARERRGDTVREVRCTRCRRCVVITGLGPNPVPNGPQTP